MIGEPYHRPFPNDLGDRILNDLPGVLIDNRKHRRDVLAQGFSFCPSGERYRYGVQKRHSALAVGCDDGIPNTRQSDMQLFTLLVQGGLALAQEGCRVVQGLSNLLHFLHRPRGSHSHGQALCQGLCGRHQSLNGRGKASASAAAPTRLPRR